MEVYCLNHEAYDEYCFEGCKDQYEWLVYWYESGYYDGQGQAVALRKDGLLELYDLGHCSCYGPFDAFGMNASKITQEQFFEEEKNVLDSIQYDEIRKKVVKLLK